MKKRIIYMVLFSCLLISNYIKAQNCSYLVITPDVFLSPTSNWNYSLVTFENNRGFNTIVVSIPTTTTAEQIKSIIASCYNNNPLKYVLLVGNGKNVNPGPASPGIDYQYKQHGLVSSAAAFQMGTYIPFFSMHCSTYWNPNGVDVATDDPYVADLTSHGRVYIGRVPAASIQEIENYVSKLSVYINGSTPNNLCNSKEIVLNLDVTHPTNLCTGSLVTQLNNSLLQHIQSGISVTELDVSKFYNGNADYNDNGAFGYSATRDALFSSSINSGAAIITLLATGGGPNNFGGWYWADRSSFNLNNVNTSLPFLIAPNCGQGEVNNPDYESVMRKLLVLRNGGIIGAMAPTENSEQHANGYLLNRFHDLIFQQPQIPYGQIFATLKDELKSNYSDLPYFYNSFTYFGDPSLMPSIIKQASGTLTSNTTWSGDVSISSTVIVPENITLTIQPGAKLNFYNGARLVVRGSLNAVGTSSNKIIFDFQSKNSDLPNGIRIENQTSNAVIKYATIQNAYYGVYTYATNNVDIEHCNILLCYIGIYPYYTNGYPGTTNISDNKIRMHDLASIAMLYSSSYIKHNDLSFNGSGVGIWVGSGANPKLGGVTSGDNILTYNMDGVYAVNYCTVEMGAPFFSSNNIVENNYRWNVFAYGSQVFAENNWWGVSGYYNVKPTMYWSNGGSIDFTLPLSDRPNIPLPQTIKAVSTENTKTKSYSLGKVNYSDINTNTNNIQSTFSFDSTWSLKKKFGYISWLIDQKQNLFARKICRDIINSNGDSLHAIYALNYLLEASKDDDILALKTYLNLLKGKKIKQKISVYADIMLADLDKDNRMARYDEILKNNSDSTVIQLLKSNKFFYYLNELNDRNKAIIICNELKDQYPNNSFIDYLFKFLGPDYKDEVKERLKKNTEENNMGSNIPKEYQLFNSYPNPFNPITTIKYAVPVESHVTLDVYNMLGEKVVELVNDVKSAGYHITVFDGNTLSSGIYIYRITANSLETGKKFVKSAKMMLVK